MLFCRSKGFKKIPTPTTTIRRSFFAVKQNILQCIENIIISDIMMKRHPVEITNRVFPGRSDESEKIVACLHFCSFYPFEYENVMHNQKVELLEKGVLYRGMIDLSDLSLLDKCYFMTQKFIEFSERYGAPFGSKYL